MLIELSEQLAIYLPEQQNSVAYKIKQEEFGKKNWKGQGIQGECAAVLRYTMKEAVR